MDTVVCLDCVILGMDLADFVFIFEENPRDVTEPFDWSLFFCDWEPDLFWPNTGCLDEFTTLLVIFFPKNGVPFTCPDTTFAVYPKLGVTFKVETCLLMLDIVPIPINEPDLRSSD